MLWSLCPSADNTIGIRLLSPRFRGTLVNTEHKKRLLYNLLTYVSSPVETKTIKDLGTKKLTVSPREEFFENICVLLKYIEINK